MRLSDNERAKEQIEALLVENYGLLLQDGLVKSILDRCANRDADVILGAVVRHIEDTAVVDGRLAGKYPPAVAQVLFHAQHIEDTQRREQNEARQRAVKQTFESDNAYLRITGKIPGRNNHENNWLEIIHADVKRAAEIRQALQSRLKLDYRERLPMLLLMQTLERAKGRDERLLPVEEAVGVGETLWGKLTGPAPVAEGRVVQNWYEPASATAELPDVPL